MCIPFATPNHSPHRPPNKIDGFALYCNLHDIAAANSEGRGYPDGTSCVFQTREIEQALHAQHVRDHDMADALAHCRNIKLLELRDDGYHLTINGLSTYICLCRPQKPVTTTASPP